MYTFEKRPVFIIADPHTFYDTLKNKVMGCEFMHDCILFIAGDNGLGLTKPHIIKNECEQLNKLFATRNVICFMIRGNHDNPSYFDGETINMSNLHAIPDYTVVQVGDENILCVGGAISIDRVLRKQEHMNKVNCFKQMFSTEEEVEEAKKRLIPSYFSDEIPTFNLEKLSEISVKIDHVITHTSPQFAFKNDALGLDYWFRLDAELQQDKLKERGVFTSIYAWLMENGHNIKTWTFGHFHSHDEMELGGCMFTALHRCDEIFDFKEIIFED